MPAIELNKSVLKNSANLKAYYRFLNGALGTDDSGNGVTLSQNSSPAYSSDGKYGNAVDVSAGFLSAGNNLGIDGSAISISCWVKLKAEITTGLWDIIRQNSLNTNTGNGIWYDYNGGTRRLAFRRTRWNVSHDAVYYNVALGTTDFHHLVVTYDGTNVRAYFDGNYIGIIASSGNGTGSNPNLIAIPNGLSNLLVSDAAFFNRALTSNEINELYEGRNYGEFMPNTNTKALFRFNNNYNDSSPNNRHMNNLTGSPSFVNGRFGKGLNLPNGAGASITSNVGITTGAITISIWVKLTADITSSEINIIHHNSGDANDIGNAINYQYNAGTRRLFFRRTKWNVAHEGPTYNIALGTSGWHNIIYTYDGTNVRGYLNGILVAGPTAASGNGSGTTAEYLGSGMASGTGIASILDEVLVEDRVWSASEIRNYYNKSKGAFVAKMV